ncbi:hypothetical protein [Microbacterium sp. No. 7]|uniref:hypothetical protein n=1 Tax=Microbacterium sp. No. 7 TaxID=1714373 RepID=UPI000AF6023B|nr:hypothetical protein [Microbacterium sp. No. 7]
MLTRLDGTVAETVVDGIPNNMAYEAARFVELVHGADETPDQQRTAAVLRIADRLRP